MTQLFEDLSGLADATTSRRAALRKGAGIGLAAAAASIPFLKPGRAYAQSTDGDFGILNYALTLEYLERSFYRQALATGFIPGDVTPLFQTIENDEAQHVLFLRSAINGAGGTPVQYTDDDFSFDGFLGDFASIATLAQGLEDTGVRAYKGQAASIMNKDYLTAALQIHSVEARHAAAIRRLSASPAGQGWIERDQPGAPAPIAAVYAAGMGDMFPSEDNVTQGGVDLTAALSGYTRAEITEAFDEPLDMDSVLGIAGPFITGDEGDGEED
ncbi:MAG TPA: ferritin-like domain-containing protein [Bacteroidetes bacterium]|nr:ferritin-like domain-containing protein [Bacteroidota bacterium]HIL57882.1 ferritin-like domain-containing protein [Rhodothermales bacterium]